ncbi:IS1096 element passenger TnpR family protein [Thiocapsa marina]|uniref:Plasmid pRiA4b Orf3-like domain-containing protein n=1 Tax=Thiocapsa marina 5811 TaxID=768671 RepID=F9UE09_9GAMM|nr:hypothetical protein [Thiocapsa marina]EGV17566.1 hypothetical protein ThimaDRAFT_3111 [Thiocapsa marina 5811]
MSTLSLDSHTFDPRAAGTLLADFDRLLELIGDRGLALSPKHAFASTSLEAINQGLAKPVRLGLKRTMQKSYPVIGGLYLLLRASGLGQIDAVAKPPRLVLDPAMLNAWSALNDTERYFALLKAWWGRGNNAMIGERISWSGDLAAQVIDFAKQCLTRGCPHIEHPDAIISLKYRPGLVNLALFELFGLFEIQVMPPEEGQGWRPGAITLLPWGRTLLSSVLDARHQASTTEVAALAAELSLDWVFDPSAAFEDWSRSIRPALPEWRHDLESPEADFQPGAHQFKVSLGAPCWRRIRCGGETDLAALASTILTAFDFDEDHLYRFSYQDRYGQTVEIDHADLEGETDNAVADEVRIGELSLTEGQRIEFLFDFGDAWTFEIVAERPEAGFLPPAPLILESHGEAPAQYGEEWDE